MDADSRRADRPPASAYAPVAAARWQVNLLGGLSVTDGAQRFDRLPSRAITALLARLALLPERAHPREELVELLWPGVAVDVGRNRLRQALSSLKGLLEPAGGAAGPVITADRLCVRVVPGALACDARLFEQHLRARRHPEARALYRGELLPGFYDEWIDDERTRLAALHDRLPPEDAAAHAPGARAPSVAPPPAVLDVGRETLPTYLTRLFGSEVQASRLRAQLLSHRLVTLIGPGGSGKTRLAVEVAHSLRDTPAWPLEGRDGRDGRDGAPRPFDRAFDQVVFVSLVGCRGASQFADALLAALQVRGSAEAPVERLFEVLPGRRMLLVLDNFEQLVGEADGLVARLVAMLPQLHLLVTSRRVLGLDGEREFALTPLAPPDAGAALDEAAGNPAVALFVDRARAVRADFHLGTRNHPAIVELVRLLEGMPLAIELAASRVRSHAPAEMLALLRPAPIAGATPQLDLLARSGPRSGSDPRHASMQRVIEWSWEQLSPQQARLLAGLAVFHGGFSAAAAHALWGGEARGSPMLLDELQSRCLLQSRETASGQLRFSLYEPIREFAALRQPEDAAAHWRERHRAWMLQWARALPATHPLGELRAELPNLLAALAGAAADGAADVVIDLLATLGRSLEDVELTDEGLAHAAQAIETGADPLRRSAGHAHLASLLFIGGQRDAARHHAQRGEALAPAGTPERALALRVLARVLWHGDRRADLAEPLLAEARALADPQHMPEERGRIHSLQAVIAAVQHRDHARAEALQREALALWERQGNQHLINAGRYALATNAQEAGRNEEALDRVAPVIESTAALENWRRLSQAFNVRGNALTALRRWPESTEAFRECLRVAWAAMAPYDLAFGLWNLPRALAHVREPERALRIAAFAVRFWQQRFGALSPADLHDLRRVKRLAAVQLPAARCEAAWAEGSVLTLAEAVALALDPR